MVQRLTDLSLEGGYLLDSITQLIKNEIQKQFKSVKRFSDVSGIPYSTLSNALTKGIGSTAYDTVVKICSLLGIKQAYTDDIVLFNKEFHDVYTMLAALDEKGVHTVTTVLNVEYNRCKENDDDTTIKGFSGIGYASKPVIDDEHMLELVRRLKGEKNS